MLKRTLFLMLLMFAVSSGCRRSGEWVPLFNGQDLTGWMVKKAPADSAFTFWSVQDGCIEANSLGNREHDYVWLLTENEYTDFELRFTFQAFRDSPGNSGLQIRSRYDDAAAWLDGPQIDIHPPAPWRSGMMWDETRDAKGWIYPSIPHGEWVDSTMVKQHFPFYYADDTPAWNEMRVRVAGLRVQAWLNGVQVTDYDGTGVLDDAVHQQHRVGQRGHVALQIHKGDELKIRFRDMWIKALKN